MKVFCVNCRFHRQLGRDIWYNHICMEPSYNEAVKRIDYVTGKLEADSIYCRAMNANGDCPRFERK